jgi:hypothetical protein
MGDGKVRTQPMTYHQPTFPPVTAYIIMRSHT